MKDFNWKAALYRLGFGLEDINAIAEVFQLSRQDVEYKALKRIEYEHLLIVPIAVGNYYIVLTLDKESKFIRLYHSTNSFALAVREGIDDLLKHQKNSKCHIEILAGKIWKKEGLVKYFKLLSNALEVTSIKSDLVDKDGIYYAALESNLTSDQMILLLHNIEHTYNYDLVLPSLNYSSPSQYKIAINSSEYTTSEEYLNPSMQGMRMVYDVSVWNSKTSSLTIARSRKFKGFFKELTDVMITFQKHQLSLDSVPGDSERELNIMHLVRIALGADEFANSMMCFIEKVEIDSEGKIALLPIKEANEKVCKNLEKIAEILNFYQNRFIKKTKALENKSKDMKYLL